MLDTNILIYLIKNKPPGIAERINELDPSDRDPTGAPSQRIRNWPVYGMYQPDGIASYQFNGKTFYITANEGDDRDDFIPGLETARVSTLTLDPTKFPNAVDLKVEDGTALRYLKGETVSVEEAGAPLDAGGTAAARVLGFPVGWLRPTGRGMFKNLYPPGWRRQ